MTAEKIAVVVECSNGEVRQVALTRDECLAVQHFISNLQDGAIKVIGEPLELTLAPAKP